MCPEQEPSLSKRLKKANSALEKGGSVTVNNRKALESWTTLPWQLKEALSTFPHTAPTAAAALKLLKDYTLPAPGICAPRQDQVTQATPCV